MDISAFFRYNDSRKRGGRAWRERIPSAANTICARWRTGSRSCPPRAGRSRGEWPYFDKAEEARECRFYIEPAAERGGVPKALLDSRATMGWEYVCAIDKGALSWQNTPIKSLGISRIFGAVQTEKTPPGRARGFVQRFPRH